MNPITRECYDCPDLQEVLNDIDCTLLDLTKNKYNSIIYGVELCFDEYLYKSLLNYKRIVTGRLYNVNYPCGVYNSNELLSKVRLLTYKTNCSRCPECEEIITTTTTLPSPTGSCVTYTIPQYGTMLSPLRLFNYITCEGVIMEGTTGGGTPEQEICAVEGSLTLGASFYSKTADTCITTTTP